MGDPHALDFYLRGLVSGLFVITGVSFARSRLPIQVRTVATLLCISIMAWLITESPPTWALFGDAFVILLAAYANAAMFWLFVRVVFNDRKMTLWNWAPPLFFVGVGLIRTASPQSWSDRLWFLNNLFAAAIILHAGYLIVTGQRDDLVEGRRRLRALLLGLIAGFSLIELAIGVSLRFAPNSGLGLLLIGQPYGVAIFGCLAIATCAVFLQARPEVFGSSRPPRLADDALGGGQDARAAAADLVLLDRLRAVMDAGGWRREGLTIVQLALELETPEHRLRRLINRRLGHRNFADFLNGYRIESAKQRLADPRDAHVTVAAIAFDLGYGSLGPFNRAFRAATGMSPTAWRSDALQTSPISQDPG
jgi:AraC-like DNA-binding protein